MGVDKDLYKYAWFGNAAISSSTQVQAADGWFTDFDADSCIEKVAISTTGTLATDEASSILKSTYEAQEIMHQLEENQKAFLVTSSIYNNLMDTYENNATDSGLAKLAEGGALTYRGIPVLRQSIWGVTIASLGLSDPHRVVYTKTENLVIGTNITVDPMNQGKVLYDEKDETYGIKSRFDFGTQYEFCEYMVYAR